MKKQLLLLVTLLGMVGVKAYAHDIEVKNADGATIYYVWTNYKTELAVSYKGSTLSLDYYYDFYSGDLIIPEYVEYEGITYPVTSISPFAFCRCKNLKKVNIPDSITDFGNYAFYGCIGLTSIIIPNNVISIGNYVFSDCIELTSITFSNSLTTIGERAFDNCI